MKEKLVTSTATKNYNGPRSKLMDEISYALNEHTDPWECEGWATLELYLARACVSVEKRRKWWRRFLAW